MGSGTGAAGLSLLLALWSLTGVLAEVPAGAVADRWSRRGALAAGALGRGAAFAVWTLAPVPTGFAAGFVVWGLAGALSSGSLETLAYDLLRERGRTDAYAGLLGRVTAARLGAALPAAGLATLLLPHGYAVVGWASVATSVAAGLLALRLPEAARGVADEGEEPGLGELLRSGVREALLDVRVRGPLVAVAALTGIDALEEYLPVLASSWGVPTSLVPLALAGVPLLAAAVAGAAGRLRGAGRRALAGVALAACCGLLAAGALGRPASLVLLATAYAAYRGVLVLAEVRLQEAASGRARTTVTSVAALLSELPAFGVYAAWAVHGLAAVAALLAVVALALPALLRRRGGS
ncbi:MFS transporter [Motilibacter rhizosphaerae]|uniref:MFS transporter n=1 Tax=Motilibacter rhizosphaerae TaxID=598652 RepID=A0A4Q7NRE0_9ACTN|nr:MFS transporter [Motilibacter rhizosphaerae]RZS89474.1 MFS transporter [Motilibacter rhizosphaerae]